MTISFLVADFLIVYFGIVLAEVSLIALKRAGRGIAVMAMIKLTPFVTADTDP